MRKCPFPSLLGTFPLIGACSRVCTHGLRGPNVDLEFDGVLH